MILEPVVAIVVAAGSGVRLGGSGPKALQLIDGRPLVWHSVARLAAGGISRAVVVIAPGLADDFYAALADAPIPVSLVTGGTQRQDSVANGLAKCAEWSPKTVLIHDAARALVPPAVVARVIASVHSGAKSVVPVISVVDSLRQVNATGSVVADRASFRAVQTPQGFDFATIVAAHQEVANRQLAVTDDTAACEAIGVPTVLVDGDRRSFKVTEPIDLVIARALVKEPQCALE